jgi:hypothetical protein
MRSPRAFLPESLVRGATLLLEARLDARHGKSRVYRELFQYLILRGVRK